MIPVVILFSAFVFAFARPRGATMLVALLAAFWVEWELPIGVRLGIFETLFLGGLCGWVAGNRGRVPRRRGRVPWARAVVGFILLSVASTFVTHDVALVQHFWMAFKPAAFAASFFLFYLTLDRPSALRQAMGLFLISATVSAWIGLVQVLTGRPLGILFVGTYKATTLNVGFDLSNYQGALRAFSSLSHPTLFGAFMIFPLTLLGCTLMTSSTRRHRLRKLLAAAVLALGLIFSLTRAAWLGMAASALMATFFLRLHRHRQFWRWILVFLVLLASVAALNLVPDVVVTRFLTLRSMSDDPAMIPRYARWSYFFERSMERPWLGHGTVTDMAAVDELRDAVSPHNTFIFMAVQRGWLATAIMAALLLGMWRAGWESVRLARGGYWRGVSVGLFAGAIGTYGVAGMSTTLWEDYQSSVVFWFFLAVMLRLRGMLGAHGPLSEDTDVGVGEGTAPGDIALGR